MDPKDLKPFHLSVVAIIKMVQTKGQLEMLERLLRATKIPENHDEIMAAYRDCCSRLRSSDMSDVVGAILAQKQAAEEEKAERLRSHEQEMEDADRA
ncbi:MAG: hypothetical protein V4674_02575 [Patescibacteria group bacterium]